MKFPRSNLGCTGVRFSNNESGLILIAALTLLTALTLLGATAFIVASTDVKVGGNFRTNHTALQVAMAGAEQARQTLRAMNSASATKTNFSEELATRVGGNAALDGYTTSTDDSAIAASSTLLTGYSYNAYLTNDASEGPSNIVDANGKVVITSVANGPNNSKAIVQTTVQLYSFSSSSPATIYSKDNVTVSGSSISISGADASPSCGGSGLAPIYTMDPATTTQNGSPTLTGSPATPEHGNTDIDLEAYVDSLKGGASVTLTSDVSNGVYGSASNFVTVYADAAGTQADGELKLTNATGYGILLVNGDIELAGNLNWQGLIIVTGKLKTTGGGSDGKNILGQVYSGKSDLGDSAISGSVTVSYHSCNVKNALASQPLKLVNWKQSY
jgi:Tfp pilus assembly protein PilX